MVRLDFWSLEHTKIVRQGSILAPALFNAYGVNTIRASFFVLSEGVKVGERQINNLTFADHIALCKKDLLEKKRVSGQSGLMVKRY